MSRPKLLVVIAVCEDETRHLLFVRPDFDVQTWAESRRDGFKMLRICRLIVQEIDLSEIMEKFST